MGNILSLKNPLILTALPIDKSHLNKDQRHLIKYMRLTWATCATWCYLGYKYLPMTLPAMPSLADRLGYTIQWQLPGITFALIALVEVAVKRFGHDALRNPLEEDADATFEVQKRVLSNTMEQVLLNSSSQLMLTTLLSEQEMRIIPLLSTLFLFGRVCYFLGWKPHSHMNRAYGFCVTIIPTIAMVALCWRRFVPHTVVSLFQ